MPGSKLSCADRPQTRNKGRLVQKNNLGSATGGDLGKWIGCRVRLLKKYYINSRHGGGKFMQDLKGRGAQKGATSSGDNQKTFFFKSDHQKTNRPDRGVGHRVGSSTATVRGGGRGGGKKSGMGAILKCAIGWNSLPRAQGGGKS